MDKVASAAMRRCLRTGRALRCQTSNSASKCVATKICAARSVMTSSSSPPTISKTISSLRTQHQSSLRSYSSSSTPPIQDTIGSGSAGIPQEAARAGQALEAPEHLNAKEREIWEILMKALDCERLEVQDISGGCGSMYGIDIVSERFRGLSMLKQQRLVNEVLGEEIKGWHGVQLKTKAP